MVFYIYYIYLKIKFLQFLNIYSLDNNLKLQKFKKKNFFKLK